MPSSNGKDKYRVIHLDSWSCACPDFVSRCRELGLHCKHIKALQQFLKLRGAVEVEDFDVNEVTAHDRLICPFCKSEKITKQGFRKNKSSAKQKYKCETCQKSFVNEPIKYIKGDAKMVCLAMDCYYKGLSLRDIKDMFKQFYSLDLHHETIRRWTNRFTEIMDRYTEKFEPQLGNKWHIDEQMVKSGKEWRYCWDMIDSKTRFLIANNVTKGRSIKEAKEVLQKAKKTTHRKPRIIVTDGLQTYKKALVKEYGTTTGRHLSKPLHLHNVGVRDIVNNNILERYHNEFREFDKVRRGFKNDKTTQQWSENFRVYHNFIKPNVSLGGLTPAEASNIHLGLVGNRWLRLLERSVRDQNEC